jgi:large subunit ribosomal protein L14
MLQVGSIIKICDKTGVNTAQCIKVLGSYRKRIAYLGDVIIISIISINPKKFLNVKQFKKKRFLKGTIHRALIIRTKCFYKRTNQILIKFNENNAIIINKKIVPISNRIYGPVPIELCRK